MHHKLPIHMQPALYSYLHHAYPLSVMPEHPHFFPWLHSHYIQWSADPEFFNHLDEHIFVNYYQPMHTHHYNELLHLKIITADLLSRMETGTDLIAFFKRSIDQGDYVYLFLDEFYLPGKAMYRRHHFAHDTLLFGYDDEEQVFHTLGFNHNYEYGQTDIGYEPFLESYRQADRRKAYYTKEIILYNLNKDRTYPFDSQLVMESLEDYVLSRNSSERYRSIASPNNHVYGLKVYEEIVKYLRLLQSDPTLYRNIIPVHLLWEHKKMMADRLKYMKQHRYWSPPEQLTAQYQEIEREAFLIRKLFYKYAFFIKEDTSLLEEAIAKIQMLAVKESQVLEQVLNELHGKPIVSCS